MIVKYDLKGYAEQSALPDKYQTLMDASVESVDGDIVLKFKKFLVEERGNDIIVDGSCILACLTWGFLTLLAVGANLLQDFLPPGTT